MHDLDYSLLRRYDYIFGEDAIDRDFQIPCIFVHRRFDGID